MDKIDFLTGASEPWVAYRAMVDLQGLGEEEPEVRKAKERMLEHPLVQGLIDELHQWPGIVLNSHKSAAQLYHKLEFIADLGLTQTDDDFETIISKVMAHPSEEGLCQLPTNIPVHFGGTGQVQWAWALCDAPVILYAIAKMGLADHSGVRKGVGYLLSLVRENGWPCVVSKELGKFRGPGRKDDPCPYVNLIMLKLLALYPEYRDCRESRIGVECLLDLWSTSLERHPYMFFMGTDFRKLKAPFIWYDILHVVDVLSQFDFARSDDRFKEMLAVINAKADQHGLFTLESEWKAWQGWDFGQKKLPSPWLTFLVYRINKRAGVL